jgi:serine phosphatase RsbU (regulator of sigma subunit)
MPSDAVVQNLLMLLAGAALINALFAAALWRSTRDRLFGLLFGAWAAGIVSMSSQGVLTSGDLVVTLGFATVFFNNAAFALLLAAVVDVTVPWRWLLLLFGACVGASCLAAAAGAPFVVIALPTAIGVAAPTAVVIWRVFRRRWGALHAQGRALVLSCLVFSVHNVDFVFLRNRPAFVPLGFTIAFLVVFSISISAPAALLELVTKRQAHLAAQLDIARTLQTRLAPTGARSGNLEFACHMRQAESVGGDYLHHFRRGDTEWFFVADVAGHGFHSGILALMAHSALVSILEARPDISPRELNHLVNQILSRNLAQLEDRRFMTIVSIRRDGPAGPLVLSGCHEDLLVYRASSRDVETVPVAHFPFGVGFTPDLRLEQIGQATLELGPGDLLFAGTDGVFEAARLGDHRLGQFGAGRVVEVLSEAGERPLPDIRSRLLARLEEFTGGRYDDDVAFLMLRPRVEAVPA